MRILSIEDDHDKCSELFKLAKEIEEHVDFDVASNMAEAIVKVQEAVYDLIVLDLMLPMVEGSEPVDVGGELIHIVGRNGRNRFANMVALTAYRELFERREQSFAAAGVFLIHYEKESDNWKPTISSLLRRSAAQARCQFLIVCALELESTALFKSRALLGENTIVNGLDTREIEIGRRSGRVIGLPRSGLVTAASVTAAAIERFRPRLVAMSGICAGIRGRTQLGQVLVCERCWEYQVGKYVGGLHSKSSRTKQRCWSRQEFAQVLEEERN